MAYSSHSKITAKFYGVGALLAGIIFPATHLIMGTFRLEMLIMPVIMFPIAGVFFYMAHEAGKLER
jgi:hypothetical protein